VRRVVFAVHLAVGYGLNAIPFNEARRWVSVPGDFAKGGVAMLMLGFSAGFCVEPSEPKGHRPVRPSWFSLSS
jgi:hypothetical protein